MVAIVSRQAWGANPLATPAGHIATPTPELWLHHTASQGLHGASGMRSLQSNARGDGYVDIPYSYMVDTDGQIYECRGYGRDSAATSGRNSVSHAICTMGNYEVDHPPEAMLNAIAALVRDGAALRWWPNQLTGSHSDVYATACPGQHLRAQIGEINRRALQGETAPPKPTPPPEEEEVEMIVITAPGYAARLYTGTTAVALKDSASVQALNQAGVKSANVTARDYDTILKSVE